MLLRAGGDLARPLGWWLLLSCVAAALHPAPTAPALVALPAAITAAWGIVQIGEQLALRPALALAVGLVALAAGAVQLRHTSGVVAAGANSCSRPLESARVPKASLPCTRRSMSRPATETTSPVSEPGSMPAWRWAMSAVAAVTS